MADSSASAMCPDLSTEGQKPGELEGGGGNINEQADEMDLKKNT